MNFRGSIWGCCLKLVRRMFCQFFSGLGDFSAICIPLLSCYKLAWRRWSVLLSKLRRMMLLLILCLQCSGINISSAFHFSSLLRNSLWKHADEQMNSLYPIRFTMDFFHTFWIKHLTILSHLCICCKIIAVSVISENSRGSLLMKRFSLLIWARESMSSIT